MGCNSLFNQCVDASDLSGALMVVPLAADVEEEGVTHVYMARGISDDNVIDSKIVKVPTEVLEQYNNSNKFEPHMLSAESSSNFINHSVKDALDVIKSEGSHEQFEDFDTIYAIFENPDQFMPAATRLGIDENSVAANQIEVALEAVLGAVSEAAQSVNGGVIPEGYDIAGYSHDEMKQILIGNADHMNGIYERLQLAQDIQHYGPDLIESINNYPDFSEEIVNALEQDVHHGAPGSMTYDEGRDFNADHNMTMVPTTGQ